MIVERTQPSVIILEKVMLKPGINVVSDKREVEALQKNPTFKEQCKLGFLIVNGASKSGGIDIPKKAADKIALIKKCLNYDDLEKFEEGEERTSVLNAIEEQREILTEDDGEKDE